MATVACPSEQEEGEAFSAELTLRGIKHTHIPNETGGDKPAILRGLRMQRAGTSPGFPDYLVYTHGKRIAIELKRVAGSKTSDDQREWLIFLSQYGYHCAVCHGAAEAMEFVNEVIKGSSP